MSLGATPRQAELLAFLRVRQASGGPMPSYEEMAAAIGLSSKSGVWRMVSALERRGAIRRLPNCGRSVEVVELEPVGGIDEATELSLQSYCLITGIPRGIVIANALQEYFGLHPIDAARKPA